MEGRSLACHLNSIPFYTKPNVQFQLVQQHQNSPPPQLKSFPRQQEKQSE